MRSELVKPKREKPVPEADEDGFIKVVGEGDKP